MEKIFKLLALTLLASLGIICSLSSCSDNDDTTDNPNNNEEQNQNQEENNGYSSAYIQDIIKNNVSIESNYKDYTFTFVIKSKVKSKLPKAKVEYAVGHRTKDTNDETYSASVGDQAYYYSSYTNGEEETITIKNPFWYYYVFIDDNSNFGACSFYFSSYLALKEKGLSNLSPDEKDLYYGIVDILDDAEKEARKYYTPSVEIFIDNKSYNVKTYRIP